MTRTAALVLAGGQARRMGGGDKPLLILRGRTMLDHVLAALDVPVVAISANGDPARFGPFGLPVLPDGDFAGEGPLAGLLAGLNWAAGLGMTDLLTVPCDTPFLPRGLAAGLAPAPGCALCGGRRHHLVALWPVAVHDLLKAFLSESGSRHVSHFADYIRMRYVDFPALSPDSFMNVNTLTDLAAAEEIAGNALVPNQG